MFLLGSGLVGYQSYVIYRDVTSHATRVTYFLAAFGLGLMATLIGAYWMLRGLAGYTALRNAQTDPKKMRMLFIVSGIVIVSIIIALKLWLGAQWYDS